MKLDPRKAVTSNPQTKTSPRPSIDEADVAMRAYELWVERGSPDGSPEQDWFRAEQELKGNRQFEGTAA